MALMSDALLSEYESASLIRVRPVSAVLPKKEEMRLEKGRTAGAGLWLSWESASFARKRSAVRIRSAPPF